jgi:hypothetical protein
MVVFRACPWRLFNLCMRVCGLIAFVMGAGLLVWGVMLGLHNRPNNTLTNNPGLGPPLTMAGVWFLLLGVAMLRARTYRPDLGDASFFVDPFGARLLRVFPPKRSWWTGDPTQDFEDSCRITR